MFSEVSSHELGNAGCGCTVFLVAIVVVVSLLIWYFVH